MSFIRKFESEPGPYCNNLLVARRVWLEQGRQSKHLQTNVIAAIVFY